MSDNDFIIIDEEKETPVAEEVKETEDAEKKEVSGVSAKEKHEDEYEKICFICHRSAESYHSMSGLYAKEL